MCVCVLFVAKVGVVHSPLALCVLLCTCVCMLFVAKVGGVHSPLACACWFVLVCVCYSLQRWEVCTHL